MKEGIYSVVFESSQQSVGEGLVVVSNGRVHGGDIACTIRGGHETAGDGAGSSLLQPGYSIGTGNGGGLLAGTKLL